MDDPLVKGELDGIERRYGTLDALTNPDAIADIEARAARWKEYHGSSKNYLNSQLSPKSQEWYETFDIHKRYLGGSTQAAAEFANQVVNPTQGQPSIPGYLMENIQNGVRSKLSGWVSDDNATYAGAYEHQIVQLASRLAAVGMKAGTAIDVATEKVFAGRFHFGGDPLVGLEGQNLPEDYQEILSGMVDDYRVMDARGRIFEGTPTFAHVGGGLIAMRDRDNGTFLEDERGSLIVFNVEHLRDQSAKRRFTREQEAIDAARLENDQLQQGRRDNASMGMLDRMMLEPEGPEMPAPSRPAVSSGRGPSRGQPSPYSTGTLPTAAQQDSGAPEPQRRPVAPGRGRGSTAAEREAWERFLNPTGKDEDDFVSPSVSNRGVR